MESDKIFIPNISDIVFEEFEDEIVVINLTNGFYYSINNPGMFIWGLMVRKFSPIQILEAMRSAYPDMKPEFEKLFFSFFTGLISEGIIVKEDGEGNPVPEKLVSEIKKNNGPVLKTPVLEKYTDQQELLLLDPIHEVSDLGWPESNKEEPENE